MAGVGGFHPNTQTVLFGLFYGLDGHFHAEEVADDGHAAVFENVDPAHEPVYERTPSRGGLDALGHQKVYRGRVFCSCFSLPLTNPIQPITLIDAGYFGITGNLITS